MTRWQRLNFGEEVISGYRNDSEWLYARDVRDLPAAKYPDAARRMVISRGMDLLYIAHLEYPLRMLTLQDVVVAVISTTLDYFYGPWREAGVIVTGERVPSEEFSRRVPSLQEYRYGLVCAVLADDGEAIERLARAVGSLVQWPDVDVAESGLWRHLGPREYAVHVLLARWLAGRTPAESPELVESVRAGRGDRAKLLLKAFEALSGDREGFAPALLEYVSYFQDYDFDGYLNKYVGPEASSIEGSILWHVARRAGCPLPDLGAVRRRRPKFKVKRAGVPVPVLETSLADYILFPSGLPMTASGVTGEKFT